MKVLVTGATGFVGTHALERIAAEGHEILASYHRRPAVEKAGVRWVAMSDAGSAGQLHELLTGVDAVLHLAGLAHLPRGHRDRTAAEFMRVNVDATLRIAQSAADAGVRRFVFMSSVKACGEVSVDRPMRETDRKTPEDAYGVSKSVAEDRLAQLAAGTGIEHVVIRPPLVYGPGVGANFLSLLRWIDRGLPLPLASIRNRRSLIYVGNLVDAICACLFQPRAAGRTYFVSDDEDVSTPELIRQIAAALGRPARLLPGLPWTLRAMGTALGRREAVERLVSSLAIDISRIRDELNWRPPCSLQAGLAATATWYRSANRSGESGNV
ncbi:MAG: NAD-dependent epimerase/dehydratase family protein [Betaproteobacteria bacterium]|nr:MAG: NAD-dependent epimerase/dehydratase family protein [Betaproteobacteria bacterium]